ncbi:DUF2798 domain-containing protein [Enterococcus saccharolyticus]|uniref:DUF2798 domain-containing protein n=1 Tax=Candidatus Enterococcus willemsii TaxID=1857215 RepID=A0ABQ6YZS0_9ENTE|nr:MULTISPECIES: DUF2798 domain-containing protein [Enterococcus]KAF1304030.1 DUF2798 domain-containing protein [Enterococcus sp. CU12B]MCD5002109.1 DUF2798 domain-containing protein [Enterococcus saccharolyticus]
MPNNKKEEMFFTTIMCMLMVFGMSAYNLVLHQQFSFGALIKGFLPGFIVAFMLDVFLVGAVAKKIVHHLPINKSSKLQVILTITGCMVIGMVLCMSLFGVLMSNGFDVNFWSNYFRAIQLNIIVAFPLQLLVVGPIARLILNKLQQATTN